MEGRTSGKDTILRASKLGLAIIIVVLIGLSVVTIASYESNERYENTKKAPALLHSAASDEDSTLVIYLDHSYHSPTYETFCVLDGEGSYEHPPKDLGKALPDFVPMVNYHNSFNLEDYTRFLDTGGGVVAIHLTSVDGVDYSLQCIPFVPDQGTFGEPIVAMREGLNYRYAFDATSTGQMVHVLVWNGSHTYSEEAGPNIYYTNSGNGGRTWGERELMLPSAWQVDSGHVFAHGDQVRLLLVGATDSMERDGPRNDLLFVSEDGGTTWEGPIVCTGDPLIRKPTLYHGTVDAAGNTFMFGRADTRDYDLNNLYTISPEGTVARIAPIGVLQYIDLFGDSYSPPMIPLFFHDETTDEQLMFVLSTQRPDTHYLVRMDGTVAKAFRVPERERDLGIIQPTRYEDDWIYGMGVKGYSIGECAVEPAFELRLFRMNVETGDVDILGKPYEVVYRHTDSEEETYDATMRSIFLLTLTTLVALGIMTLLARKYGSRPDLPMEHPAKFNRWAQNASIGLVFYYALIFMAMAAYGREYIFPVALTVGYFAVAILMIEIAARNWDNFRHARLLYFLLALAALTSIMMVITDYNNPWGIGSVQVFGGVFLLWAVLLIMSISITRAIWITSKAYERRRIGLAVCACTFLFVLAMPFLLMASMSVW